jgi:hypothetical protein
MNALQLNTGVDANRGGDKSLAVPEVGAWRATTGSRASQALRAQRRRFNATRLLLAEDHSFRPFRIY